MYCYWNSIYFIVVSAISGKNNSGKVSRSYLYLYNGEIQNFVRNQLSIYCWNLRWNDFRYCSFIDDIVTNCDLQLSSFLKYNVYCGCYNTYTSSKLRKINHLLRWFSRHIFSFIKCWKRINDSSKSLNSSSIIILLPHQNSFNFRKVFRFYPFEML